MMTAGLYTDWVTWKGVGAEQLTESSKELGMKSGATLAEAYGRNVLGRIGWFSLLTGQA
ncbi:hypothetical protein HPP92_028881 [Vanilla planifolia]|uniref:Uncharacterized protein n=1 Tax=Vanilla planifolia TaxID=51239 RepID=A0A835P5R1_VANPL|nr:hypothetical protein HPP92_028881 [Vanilla planifolia]KAG0446368.1 hypothetical protein HPP92_028870 [Vanilla planifolia]